METMQLRMPTPGDGEHLAEILQGWLGQTRWSSHVSEVDATADRAIVTLTEGDRRLELRLRPDTAATPTDPDRWRLDAGAWLVPAGPSKVWSALFGFMVFAFGLAISLGYLGWSSVAFWIGLGVSLVLGLVVGRIAWRHAVDGRTTSADPARAHELLSSLEPVLRSDERVYELAVT